MKNKLIERLSTYTKVNTQSDESKTTVPTTEGQRKLAEMLVKELNEIGMQDVTIDENSYVFATLPSNSDKDVKTIGFLAHLDTATEVTGENVNPQIVVNYDGEEILLNEEQNIVLSPKDFPQLKNYIGHTLMTTDGTTLLGADNKAGIAEIMTAMEYLINNPEIKHGDIRVAFTPDEEIGRGPHNFDVEKFNASYAYTVDGGPIGELQYESFNAAVVRATFTGTSVHPGTAKGIMVNAGKMASEYIQKFPELESPEHTEGYEGFYHLISVTGDVEKAEVVYIIRDFDREKFEERKEQAKKFGEEMNKKYGADRVQVEVADQYYNMREKIEPVMEVVDIAKEAMNNLNIEPIIEPIRGGTDGSQLSYMGLPTPNIFTGGENFHGPYEFASIDDMEKATKVIVEICKLYEKHA